MDMESQFTEDETPKPITAEQFKAGLSELVVRAKAAGLRPAQMMVASYLTQGLSMVDGLLGALEGDSRKNKKAEEKAEVKAEEPAQAEESVQAEEPVQETPAGLPEDREI